MNSVDILHYFEFVFLVYGKMKLFQDQIQRIVDMDERLPTGSDVCHVLKHFEDTLLGYDLDLYLGRSFNQTRSSFFIIEFLF